MSAGPREDEKYAWKMQKMDTLDEPDVPTMQQSVGQRKDWLAS